VWTGHVIPTNYARRGAETLGGVPAPAPGGAPAVGTKMNYNRQINTGT
jgi:hypothetical protein